MLLDECTSGSKGSLVGSLKATSSISARKSRCRGERAELSKATCSRTNSDSPWSTFAWPSGWDGGDGVS